MSSDGPWGSETTMRDAWRRAICCWAGVGFMSAMSLSMRARRSAGLSRSSPISGLAFLAEGEHRPAYGSWLFCFEQSVSGFANRIITLDIAARFVSVPNQTVRVPNASFEILWEASSVTAPSFGRVLHLMSNVSSDATIRLQFGTAISDRHARR